MTIHTFFKALILLNLSVQRTIFWNPVSLIIAAFDFVEAERTPQKSSYLFAHL